MSRLWFFPALPVLLAAYACDAAGPPTSPETTDLRIQADKIVSPTFTVEPSYVLSGVPDWENLNAAFDAAIAAGAGSVVQLGAGDFYLHKPVEVEGFVGNFTGAGVDQTTINMALGEVFGLHYNPVLDLHASMFIVFMGDGGTVSVSDMTLRAEEFTELWFYYGQPANFLLTTVLVDNQNAIFEDLKIVGRQDAAYLTIGYSIRHGVELLCIGEEGATEAEFKRIEVHSASFGATVHQCPKAHVTIGGRRNDGIYHSSDHGGIYVGLAASAHVSHSHAVGNYEGGIRIVQVPSARVEKNYTNSVAFIESNGTITHNTLTQTAHPINPWSGVELWNSVAEVSRNEIRGAEQTYVDPGFGCNWYGPVLVVGSEAMIVDNDISTETNTTDCAAIFAWSSQNGTIRSNGLAGDLVGDPHFAGIYLGFIDNWNIQDNNVRQLEACPDIHLSAYSTNNVVVGNRHTSVLDEGTGNTLRSVGPYDCAAPVAASTRANLSTLGAGFEPKRMEGFTGLLP